MTNALNLNIRPLKWFFDALKAYDPDKMRKAMRRLMFFLPKRPMYFFMLWKANAEKAKAAEEK
jgi:hypothetical protein